LNAEHRTSNNKKTNNEQRKYKHSLWIGMNSRSTLRPGSGQALNYE